MSDEAIPVVQFPAPLGPLPEGGQLFRLAPSSETLAPVSQDESVASDQSIGVAVPPEGAVARDAFWRMSEIVRHNKVVIAAGMVTVASLVANPMGKTMHALAETVHYEVPGMFGAECIWIAGAAAMLAAVGRKPRSANPMKIKSDVTGLSESPARIARPGLFHAGFAINTVAALAECAIPTIAVTANLPVESWGVLAFSTLDLWATVVIRRAIWRGTHSPKE